MVRVLAAGLLSTALAVCASAQSRQQTTDNLVNQLTQFSGSASNVSGAQNLVNQSNSFEQGQPTNISTPGGQTTTNGPSGGSASGGSGIAGGATEDEKNKLEEKAKELKPALAPITGGVQSQIQGTTQATTAASASTNRPPLLQQTGVTYGRAAASSFGFTNLRQPRFRPPQRSTRTTGSYEAQ